MSLPVCPDVSESWPTATANGVPHQGWLRLFVCLPLEPETGRDVWQRRVHGDHRQPPRPEPVRVRGEGGRDSGTLRDAAHAAGPDLRGPRECGSPRDHDPAPQTAPTATPKPVQTTTTPTTTKATQSPSSPSSPQPTSGSSPSAASDSTSSPAPTSSGSSLVSNVSTATQPPPALTPDAASTPTPLPLVVSSGSSASFELSSSRESWTRPGSDSAGSLSGADVVINGESKPSHSARTGSIIAVVGVVAAVCLLAVCWWRRRRRVAKGKNGTSKTLSSTLEGYAAVDDQSEEDLKLLPILKVLDPWRISATDIDDVSLIGSGSYGAVFLVRLERIRELASKRVGSSQRTHTRIESMINEATIAASLHHPSIIEFVGVAWTTWQDLQILFEYMPTGDLRRYLDDQAGDKSRSLYWSPIKLQTALQIAEGPAYVHSFDPPIVHRDLKARNVVLDADMNAKIGDFGISRGVSENATMTTGIGTSRWMAPEVIRGGGQYTEACDVYSFGVVLVEMDTHALPFAEMDGTVSEVALPSEMSLGQRRPQLSETCDRRIASLVARCYGQDPRERANALELAFALRQIKREAEVARS